MSEQTGAMQATHAVGGLDVEAIRRDFPILARTVGEHPLVYLDSAATSHKPNQVIDAEAEFYRRHNANAHRGLYMLGEEATQAYEGARATVARFLGAPDAETIVFTRGVTESMNLVAQGWGRAHLRPGDEILITEMEHHSNIVPWQMTAAVDRRHAALHPAHRRRAARPLAARVAAHRAHEDPERHGHVQRPRHHHAAAAARRCRACGRGDHRRSTRPSSRRIRAIDVQALDVDLLGFTGHKMLGPTASGGLYGKGEVLEAMQPMLGGGEMINEVFHDHSTYKSAPFKFEAGTMPIAQQVGLAAAIDYLEGLGMANVRAHEEEITRYALDRLLDAGATVYGPKDASIRGGAVSFWFKDVHPHDLATILNEQGVAIRAGHHCAQLVMRRYGVAATARASFYVYNTKEEVDALVESLDRAQDIFS